MQTYEELTLVYMCVCCMLADVVCVCRYVCYVLYIHTLDRTRVLALAVVAALIANVSRWVVICVTSFCFEHFAFNRAVVVCAVLCIIIILVFIISGEC